MKKLIIFFFLTYSAIPAFGMSKVNQYMNWKDHNGNTAAHLYCYTATDSNTELISISNFTLSELNQQNLDRQTPLYFAISRPDRDIAKKMVARLLERGVDVETSDYENNSPLDYAVKYNMDVANQLTIHLHNKRKPTELRYRDFPSLQHKKKQELFNLNNLNQNSGTKNPAFHVYTAKNDAK